MSLSCNYITHALWVDLWSRYDVIVDVAPEVKWIPENGYKNLKIIVEIDSEIDAKRASEQELRRRHKSLGLLRIVSDRGLQVTDVCVVLVFYFFFLACLKFYCLEAS